ncbi:MAG: ammonium transporter [SAR324 cluster bacterium]
MARGSAGDGRAHFPSACARNKQNSRLEVRPWIRAVCLTGLILAAWFTVCHAPALAQTAGAPGPGVAAAAPAPSIDRGDTAWMLAATALVLMMTIPGLALFYAGMVRKKNILGTAAQSFAVTCVVTLLWVSFGYSLAFTADTGFLGGLSRLFMTGVGTGTVSVYGNIPEAVYAMYQLTFAIITPALIAGAFADRMKFSALLWFMGLWFLFVYVPVAHWVWGKGGFLQDFMGGSILDFAGGTVVHIDAGIAGLVAALVLGKRRGFGTESMAPHNLLLAVIGACMLWVGWFGFNAGSAVAADGRAGMAMAATQTATAAAALAWMSCEWLLRGKPSLLGMISGAVAGLVAVTPASGFVSPGSSIVIGLAAGAACFWGSSGLKRRMGYDDSLDAFGVHGIGGIVGALLTGVFAAKAIGGAPGLIEGNAKQVLIQAAAVAIVIVYDVVLSFIILKAVDIVLGLRVSTEQEIEGLDLSQHGESLG